MVPVPGRVPVRQGQAGLGPHMDLNIGAFLASGVDDPQQILVGPQGGRPCMVPGLNQATNTCLVIGSRIIRGKYGYGSK